MFMTRSRFSQLAARKNLGIGGEVQRHREEITAQFQEEQFDDAGRPISGRAWLVEEVQVKDRSAAEIADEVGCSAQTVRKYISEYFGEDAVLDTRDETEDGKGAFRTQAHRNRRAEHETVDG